MKMKLSMVIVGLMVSASAFATADSLIMTHNKQIINMSGVNSGVSAVASAGISPKSDAVLTAVPLEVKGVPVQDMAQPVQDLQMMQK